jgi:DNA-binding beta-propeller fold protein YncE
MIVNNRIRRSALAVASLFLGVTVSSAAADSAYRVTAHYPLAGRGPVHALAFDQEGRILFIGQGREIEAINTGTGTHLASIPVNAPVEGIAAANSKRIFAVTGDGSVAVIDASKQKIIQTMHGFGTGPFHVAYDSGTDRLFIADASGQTVTALDGQTGKMLGTTRLNESPQEMVSNGYGHLFVSTPQQNSVHVLDTGTFKDLGAFPARYGKDCSGLALDPVGRRLFLACRNGVVNVIDTDIGFTFQQLSIGTGAAQSLFTFSPQGRGGWKGAAFIVTPDGTLTALRMNSYVSYSQGETSHLRPGVRQVAFDTQTHRLFLAAPTGPASTKWEILAVSQ